MMTNDPDFPHLCLTWHYDNELLDYNELCVMSMYFKIILDYPIWKTVEYTPLYKGMYEVNLNEVIK